MILTPQSSGGSVSLDDENQWTKNQYGVSFTNTGIKTITRNASGYITSVAYTGGRTFTYTRDANNYITSKTDGAKTWTYTRNAANQITNVGVA